MGGEFSSVRRGGTREGNLVAGEEGELIGEGICVGRGK